MEFILKLSSKYRKVIIILYSILPVLLFLPSVAFFGVVGGNRLIGIVLILNYYLSGFLFIFLMSRLYKEQIQNSARSPFHFIRRFNLTYAQNPPLRYLVGAEIGVDRGNHAKQILNGYLNIEKLVLVDPWMPYQGGQDLNVAEYDNVYKQVQNSFQSDRRVEIIRDFSINASKKFLDKYFDFIYLDGNHQYEFVLKDLEAWYPKLKQYGVMCGDDFGHPSGQGVIKAVSEFAYKYKLLVFNEDTQFWFVKV